MITVQIRSALTATSYQLALDAGQQRVVGVGFAKGI